MSVQYQTVVGWDITLKDLEYTDTDTIGEAYSGLVQTAVKVTTGAPTATANKFIRGAIVQNAFDGTAYINTGTTASPVWTLMNAGGGSGITELIADVAAGPGSGTQNSSVQGFYGVPLDGVTMASPNSANIIQFDGTNWKAVAPLFISNALAAGKIIVGDGLGVATAFTMSKDGSMDSSGNLTIEAWHAKTLDDTTFNAPTDANVPIFDIGSGTWKSLPFSGDVTMTAAGLTTVTDLTITGQATGDILYFNGTNWVRLPIGTAGQVLTVNGGATAPVWA